LSASDDERSTAPSQGVQLEGTTVNGDTRRVGDDWRALHAQLIKRLQQMQQVLERAENQATIQRKRNAAAREQLRSIRVERRKTSRNEPTDINTYRKRRRRDR